MWSKVYLITFNAAVGLWQGGLICTEHLRMGTIYIWGRQACATEVDPAKVGVPRLGMHRRDFQRFGHQKVAAKVAVRVISRGRGLP